VRRHCRVGLLHLRPAAGAGLGDERLVRAVGGDDPEGGRRPVLPALADDGAVVRHLSASDACSQHLSPHVLLGAW